MIDTPIQIASIMVLLIGILGTLALLSWVIFFLLDKLRNAGIIFKYLVEYMYYRKYFKKWFEENKGKELEEL